MGTGSGTKRLGGGGLDPSNISNIQDMISQNTQHPDSVNAVLSVSKEVEAEYGDYGVVHQFVTATIGGKDKDTIGFYDGANIGLNQSFFNNPDGLTGAMKEMGKSGFHPSIGNKTGLEAVAAHEFGHALTDAVGQKIGMTGIDAIATHIVKQAVKDTPHKGVVQMASKISKYATTSNAEAIAEAFCDTFCNGSKAKLESKAIMKVVNGYIKGK